MTVSVPDIVAEARASVRSLSIADDLAWRWQDADAEMCPPSNYSAMVGLIMMGGPGAATEVSDGLSATAVAAAEKAMELDAVLASVPLMQRATLWALYGSQEGDASVLLLSVPFVRQVHASRQAQGSAPADISVWFANLTRTARARPMAADMLRQCRREIMKQVAESVASFASARRHGRLAEAAGWRCCR